MSEEDEDKGQDPERDHTRREVHRWRRREARDAGLSRFEADRFAASDQSLQTLRKCVRNGWTPEQIAEIVL